jgi:hypothetical protein
MWRCTPVRPAGGLLTRTPLPPDSDQPAQIGYVLTTNSGIKLAVHGLAFSNTVTWQFRYEPVPGQPNEGWTHW